MKYIKMVLISFLVFFILFTLIGLLFPSSTKAVKAIVVNKNRELVLKELRVSDNWLKWYPFFQSATGAHINDPEKDTSTLYNDKKTILVFNKKQDSNSISFLSRQSNGRLVEQTIMSLNVPGDQLQTQVVWHEEEKLGWYPWERFRGLVLENAKKDYLDTLLNRFKQYIDTLTVH